MQFFMRSLTSTELLPRNHNPKKSIHPAPYVINMRSICKNALRFIPGLQIAILFEKSILDLFDCCLTHNTSHCELHLASVKHDTNTYISYEQLISQADFKPN